jgi:hypothetical protein
VQIRISTAAPPSDFREGPRRSVGNDPFSAQTDAPQQLREHVVRLAIVAEAERGILERWTISKVFRRRSHCLYEFPQITIDEQ